MKAYYYVGVGSESAKLATLTELLTALLRADSCASLGAISICCSSRDSLDAVVCQLRELSHMLLIHVLHADMGMGEREAVLSSFRQAQNEGEPASQESTALSPVLITTDAALPESGSAASLPAGKVPLLINFDLPLKKEALTRRITAAFGSSSQRDRKNAGRAAAVFFVAAGEVSTFRSIEKMLLPATILATPVHVADVLRPEA